MGEENTIPNHHALLIGVNFYPDEEPLKGSVNDTNEIKDYLTRTRAGIDVQLLTASSADAKCLTERPEDLATHDNVVAGLDSIISKALPGDLVYIHFSGHGILLNPKTQFSNGSTGDLALALLHRTGEAVTVRYLRGSELASRLKAMVSEGLLVTVVLDCCFSGGVMRKDDNSIRSLPWSSYIDAAYPSMVDKYFGSWDTAPEDRNRGASMDINWMVNPDSYCVLAACGPTETAKEMVSEGQHHGVLSYYLLKELRKRGGVGGRLHHIYAHLRATFLKQCPQQRPMLYGNKNLCFFFENSSSGFDTAPIPVSQSRRSSSTLQLEAGQAHGVRDGDKFSLWVSETSNPNLLGDRGPIISRVSRAGALRSDLEILDPKPGDNMSGATATANTHLALRNYSIRLDLRLDCRDAWKDTKELEESDLAQRNLFVHAYVMGSGWEIDNLLHADFAVIPPAKFGESRHFRAGAPGSWEKRIKLTVPQYLRDRGQLYCDDIVKIFITLESTSFMSLELPKISHLHRRHKSNPDRPLVENYPDDRWAVLSFHIRTSV
ncbi:hypothetical protein GQ53DRAFT_890551 [Thozetella sp. PMI_491]|nr:hypothetical protein GQ53DRAFT_890551 [Thozetella sp. PMI_491]